MSAYQRDTHSQTFLHTKIHTYNETFLFEHLGDVKKSYCKCNIQVYTLYIQKNPLTCIFPIVNPFALVIECSPRLGFIVHTYMHTYIHTYKHTQIRAYTYIHTVCVYVCSNVCVCIYVYIVKPQWCENYL